MKIGGAISRVRQDLNVSSDDYNLGKRIIYSHLKSTRSELYRQEIEKKGIWSGMNLQMLNCFEMELVDIAECCDFKSGKQVLKSVNELPALLDTKDGKIITGVFLPTGARLEKMTYIDWLVSMGRRYRANTVNWFVRNNHLYVVDYNPDADSLYVHIEGVWDNPEEIEKHNGCTENADECVFYEDLDFHLPGYLENRLFRIVKADLSEKLMLPNDRENDSQPPLPQQQIAQTNGQNSR